MIEFVPILATPEQNTELLGNPICKDVVMATLDYYKIIGFSQPWIGYVVRLTGQVAGSAGYKGQPVGNKIEIAYGTYPEFQNKGLGTQICRHLVNIAITTNPLLQITARTLPDNPGSISILKKNGFQLLGTIYDKDDGDVLEWLYNPHNNLILSSSRSIR